MKQLIKKFTDFFTPEKVLPVIIPPVKKAQDLKIGDQFNFSDRTIAGEAQVIGKPFIKKRGRYHPQVIVHVKMKSKYKQEIYEINSQIKFNLNETVSLNK